LGESLAKEKDKFIIWDILVNDGEYLIGETLENRLLLLENLYTGSRTSIGENSIEIYEHLLTTSLKGIYKAPSYLNGFLDLYKSIVATDLYEGLVLKKLSSKLTYGLQEKNNTDWQIKFRKETKIYNF
jgi:ATP-dependent DNA ligase